MQDSRYPPIIIRSPEIQYREAFAGLCNRRGLRRYAVEVGTERGEFAATFRKEWAGHMLLCIDPWDKDAYDELQYERQSDRDIAIHRLAACEKVVEVFQGTVREAFAVDRFVWPPDFVYLDGDHRYEALAYEIPAFWAMMSSQGILAGHDFDPKYPGVIRAVVELAERTGVPIYLTHEPNFKSWYCYRNEEVLYGHIADALDSDVCREREVEDVGTAENGDSEAKKE